MRPVRVAIVLLSLVAAVVALFTFPWAALGVLALPVAIRIREMGMVRIPYETILAVHGSEGCVDFRARLPNRRGWRISFRASAKAARAFLDGLAFRRMC